MSELNQSEDYTPNIQIDSVQQLAEDYWNNRYNNWRKSGAHFSQSENIIERRQFQNWVKSVGKKAKEKDDKPLMMLAYKVIKDYEIYPDPLVNTADHF